jgi:hypothetical protein
MVCEPGPLDTDIGNNEVMEEDTEKEGDAGGVGMNEKEDDDDDGM